MVRSLSDHHLLAKPDLSSLLNQTSLRLSPGTEAPVLTCFISYSNSKELKILCHLCS